MNESVTPKGSAAPVFLAPGVEETFDTGVDETLPDITADAKRQAARDAVVAKYATKWGMTPEEAELVFGAQ